MRLPEKLTDIDGKAFHRISEFFSRFSLDGDNPVRYYEFDSATDLEEHLANQLGELIAEWNGGALKAAPHRPPRPLRGGDPRDAPPSAGHGRRGARGARGRGGGAGRRRRRGERRDRGPEFERRMEVGKAYEVSFLSIEIVETHQIAEARTTRAEGVDDPLPLVPQAGPDHRRGLRRRDLLLERAPAAW